MYKFVCIVRTDESQYRSCQPFSNNIHIIHDNSAVDSRAVVYRATCDHNVH